MPLPFNFKCNYKVTRIQDLSQRSLGGVFVILALLLLGLPLTAGGRLHNCRSKEGGHLQQSHWEGGRPILESSTFINICVFTRKKKDKYK